MNPHPEGIYRISGLGRPLDPSYPTNRVLLGLMPALAVLGAVWSSLQGLDWGAAALAGLELALLGFLCWALTRELDPDGELAAFGAMALAVLLWAVGGPQSIVLPAAVMIATRLVNRSTGKAAEPLDSVFVVVGFTAAGWLWSWTMVGLGAAALTLDALLPRAADQEARPYHLVAATIVLAATAPQWVGGLSALRPPPYALAVLAAGGGAVLVVARAPRPRSEGDVDGLPLQTGRVRAGAALAVSLLTLAAFDAQLAPSELLATWACAAVVVLASLRRHMRPGG